MKTFHCNRCRQHVFFENVKCESCEALLGYVPEWGEISAFEASGDGTWRSLHPNAESDPRLFKQCGNYALENVCNWMLPADSPETLCPSCKLTHTIPNLAPPDNRLYWYKLEAAKRRLLYTLSSLGLSVQTRRENPENGLQFDFLEDTPAGPKVLTGHDNGLITMNIAEADDAKREHMREQMHEPYRTLLGHFRHEIGHYFFDRLIPGTSWEEPFRALFGDERADYGTALQIHYDQGPPADWEQSYVSAYATTHPWEDWAETWAHYLHMVDTVDTAVAVGLQLKPQDKNEPTLVDSQPVETSSFDQLMQQWFPLTYGLNSLNRSLGLADAYPFSLAPKVVEKLRFVDQVVAAGMPAMASAGSVASVEPSVQVVTSGEPAATAPASAPAAAAPAAPAPSAAGTAAIGDSAATTA